MLFVAAAIILDGEGRILICRRGPGGNCAYLWEFPGGKLETGESPEACVQRECREELEVELRLTGVFDEFVFEYPDREISFTFFKAEIAGGQLRLNVHEDARWVFLSELPQYEFCPADKRIIEKLKSRAGGIPT